MGDIGSTPVVPFAQELLTRGRDPEDRLVNLANERDVREKMLDKTVADSYPASDPPSSRPDPSADSFAPAVDYLPPAEEAA